MSHVGHNIRKIRGVKSLSQSDFADLFDLKRGTIGAYEEGRAEPKIDTIVDIAKYFGISLDDLIGRELSVNDLYRFDIFRKDFNEGVKHNLVLKSSPVGVVPVPFVSEVWFDRYFENNFDTALLPTLSLPLPKGKDYRAFEIRDSAMLQNGIGIGTRDVVVGMRPDKFDVNRLEINKIYLLETSSEVLLRRVTSKSLSQVVLDAEAPSSYQITLNTKDVKAIWQVMLGCTKNIGIGNQLTDNLKDLQNEIKLLKATKFLSTN